MNYTAEKFINGETITVWDMYYGMWLQIDGASLLLHASCFCFWAGMFLHLAQNEKGRLFRTYWTLFFIGTYVLGAFAYFFFVYLRGKNKRIYSIQELKRMEKDKSSPPEKETKS